MPRSCLVLVYGSGNVIAAITAVRWYGIRRYGNESAEVTILVNVPGMPNYSMKESGDVVERLFVNQGWQQPIILTDFDISGFTPSLRLGISYRRVLRRFRQLIGVEHFDEIYYAHDVVGRVPELAMNAYPDAERITFGDALGSVYKKSYHLALATGVPLMDLSRVTKTRPPLNLRGILFVLKQRLKDLLLGAPQPYQANKAVLILPMDQTGDCLDGKELFIVPKQFVLDVVSNCLSSLPELIEYIHRLLTGVPKPYYLMLLENISDGNFASFDNEVALYEDMVRRNVPLGATVFIKAHPLAVALVDEALSNRLSSDYSPRVISSKFSRYPMELWSDLIKACQVVTMSYCSISLAYIYDKAVIYSTDDYMIQKYIPRQFRDSFRDADFLYRGQLANLKNWDGQSILWKGSI